MRRRAVSRSGGVHMLRSGSAILRLVRSADLSAGDQVIDLGAGPGALTAALAATGARVTAVELDDAFVRSLERRFAGRSNVRVVRGDLLEVPVPRAAKVVANIPFGTSSAVLAKLLNPGGRLRAGLDLVVEHGFAQRVSSPVARSADAAWRAARYDIALVRRIHRTSFGPPPRVDAAHLRVRPRAPLTPDAERRLRALLAAAYDGRGRSAVSVARRVVGPNRSRRLLAGYELDAGMPAVMVPAAVWGALAAEG